MNNKTSAVIIFIVLFISSNGCAKEQLAPTLTASPLAEEQINDLPVIDGVIEPEEWNGAQVLISENESKLYLHRAGDQLFLGIRSNPLELVSGNVFLSDGNQIWVLHESAALGTAIYNQEGDSWVKMKDFEWCCRSRMDTNSARAEREAFYHTDRWLGINSYNGFEGELEYLIDLDGSKLYLAVNITSAGDPEQKQVWPVGIEDGPVLVLQGEFPEKMEFTPENWIHLDEISR